MPSSCFSTLSMSSTAEQSDVLRKAHTAGRRYAEVAATNANVLKKTKNGKASSGKRRHVLLMAQQPEDLKAPARGEDNGFVISLPGKDLKRVEKRQHFSSMPTLRPQRVVPQCAAG